MTLFLKPSNLFDEENFHEFQSILTNRINDADHFQVDLEKTTSMDSSTFNSLVKLYLEFKRFGKSIFYTNMPPNVERLAKDSCLPGSFK